MHICNRLSDVTGLRVLTTPNSCVRDWLHCHSRRQAPRTYKIGFLGQHIATDLSRQIAALRQGLRDQGYEEGRNLAIEYRWAERKLDRLPSLAAEIVALNVRCNSNPRFTRVTCSKASDIDDSYRTSSDRRPCSKRFSCQPFRPGGNVTGLVLQEFETTVKWFELLKEIAPNTSRIGLLDVPGIEKTEVAKVTQEKEDGAARSLGLEIVRATVREPKDLDQAFAGVGSAQCKCGRGAKFVVTQPAWRADFRTRD